MSNPQTITRQSPAVLRNRSAAILLTGFTAGTLDIVAACVQFYSKTGRGPEPVLRYIASGVFGRRAFTGSSFTMSAWGLFFHFLIAFGLTVFYFMLYSKWPWLEKNKWLAGVLYGIFAWVVTTMIIVPLSLVQPGPFSWSKAAVAAGILVLCIGIPISLMTHKHYLYKK